MVCAKCGSAFVSKSALCSKCGAGFGLCKNCISLWKSASCPKCKSGFPDWQGI